MIQVISASIGENGSIHGGRPGDQTGREVWVRNWYSKPWTVMLRYPDINIARAAATAAYLLAESNLVGYNQDQRNMLYQALKRYSFDVNAYIASGEKTNCDCSSFVYACYAVVLPSIRYDGDAPSTDEMRDVYTAWGFTAYTQPMYLTTPDNLLIGDLLVSEGRHTVIAWEPGDAPVFNDDLIIKKESASAATGSSFDLEKAGLYVTTSNLNMRASASLASQIMTIMKKDSRVYCNGEYTEAEGRTWLKCTYMNRNEQTAFTGFVSGSYLKKL